MCGPHVLPVSTYVSTVCSQQPLLNGQALFTAHYAFIHIAVAHGPSGSVVRATAGLDVPTLVVISRSECERWEPVAGGGQQ